MRLTYLRCFFIFLLISAQADDTWVLPSVSPVPPAADDDYLPSDQSYYWEQSVNRRILAMAKPRTAIADEFSNQSNSRCRSELADDLVTHSLYALRSLRR
jgi:hypothetical protein